jgi:hypothetical protein
MGQWRLLTGMTGSMQQLRYPVWDAPSADSDAGHGTSIFPTGFRGLVQFSPSRLNTRSALPWRKAARVPPSRPS